MSPRPPQRVPVRRRGLTMLEVIVALLIASAGFGMVMTALSQAKRAQGRSASADRELAVARTLIEEAYLNALPIEQATSPSTGVRRWSGVEGGVPWIVEVRSGVVQGIVPERSRDLVGLSSADASPPLVQMDMVVVEAGRVRLSTVRW